VSRRSITAVSALQGIGTGVIRHALEALAADGLILVRHGRAAIVAGEPSGDPRLSRRRPGPDHDCGLAGCRPHVCHPMKPSTIRGIHSILSGAFAAAQRWEWTDRNPAESAKPPTTTRQPIPATSPDDVAKVIAEARKHSPALGLYLWLVVVTGVRRGELCGLRLRDIDLDRGLVPVAFNYVVRGGHRVRKDTKTHQDCWLAIDPDTSALIATYLSETRAALAAVGAELRDDAYLFSNDPAHARPWNPDWVTHQIAAAADAAGVMLDTKSGRHHTASQLLAGGFDLRSSAARLGHKWRRRDQVTSGFVCEDAMTRDQAASGRPEPVGAPRAYGFTTG
jgi:integrase